MKGDTPCGGLTTICGARCSRAEHNHDGQGRMKTPWIWPNNMAGAGIVVTKRSYNGHRGRGAGKKCERRTTIVEDEKNPVCRLKRRTRRLLMALAGLVLIGALAAWKGPSLARAYSTRQILASTSGLRPCDRVEIHLLDGSTHAGPKDGFPVRPFHNHVRILDRAVVTGADAEAFAQLWRSQTFGWEYGAMCHEPAFGLRFHQGSTLLFETTVCFHCSNFHVTALGRSTWWGFRSTTPAASNLLERLRQLVTSPEPAAVTAPRTAQP